MTYGGPIDRSEKLQRELISENPADNAADDDDWRQDGVDIYMSDDLMKRLAT